METNLLNTLPEECSTRDVAQALGLAVRSVQLMVDRGELQAEDARRTSPYHACLGSAMAGKPPAPPCCGGPHAGPAGSRCQRTQPSSPGKDANAPALRRPRVLLIEDSAHFQEPGTPADGPQLPTRGPACGGRRLRRPGHSGELQPSVLLVNILLPGIGGATLIARLRSHPQFQRSRLIVVTSLDEAQRGVYAFALTGLPVVQAADGTRAAPSAQGLPRRLRLKPP